MRSRTSRVHLAIPVFVYGYENNGSPYKEITETVTINASGALIELATPVAKEQPVLVVNMKTGESISCHVASIGKAESGKTAVGIRFDQPAPRFWGLAFPPEDWDPASRKRPEPSKR
jgi:hypothetical protein